MIPGHIHHSAAPDHRRNTRMLEPRGKRILVLGLGNTLLQDEGVGVAALLRVEHALTGNHAAEEGGILPDHITLLDGGVMGLELLAYIEAADAVLILDAVQTGAPPGTLVRLENHEIPAVVALKMSIHEVGLQETLAMCKFKGTLPGTIVLWGVVPAQLNLGLELSPVVTSQLEHLVNAALDELASWGVSARVKRPAAS